MADAKSAVAENENSGQVAILHRVFGALTKRKPFYFLFSLLTAAVWLPLLGRSFWIDEACTYWMVHDGFVRAIQKTWHYPGQSPLYSGIASLFCFSESPLRDQLLRIPSLIGIALAAYFLYRLAEKRIAHGAGIIAVILFLLHPNVAAVGYQARPYGLAMAALMGSCWALCEWEETRSRIYLLWFVVASVLVIYLHYVFVPIFGMQGLFILYVFFVDRRRNRWVELAGAALLIALLCVPLMRHVLLMVHERAVLSFNEPPHLFDLTEFLLSSVLVAGLMIVGYLVPKLYPAATPQQLKMPSSTLFFLMCWWLLAPMLFFVISRFTQTRPFVPRYLLFTLPAQALLFGYAGIRLFGFVGGRVWALLGALVFAANPILLLRTPTNTLLPMIQFIRSRPADPVFFPSMVFESTFYNWRAGNEPKSWLMAQMTAYPVRNPVYPLPGIPTSDVPEYINGIIDSKFGDAREVVFVATTDRWKDFYSDWVTERMQRAGFHVALHDEGSFTAFIFTR
jgi:hypothetical protein